MCQDKQKEAVMASKHPIAIQMRPNRYWAAVAVTAIPLLISLIAAIFGAGVHIGSVTIPYWCLILLASSPYYFASSFFVQTNELAGLTVLEIPAFEKTAGYVYAPLWLTELQRFPRALQQDQFPGEPEQISKMPDDEADKTRSTLLRPIRITTGGPSDAHPEDLLNSRLTLEPSVTVQWQVEFDAFKGDNDEGFFEFYINIPGKTWPEKYRAILKMMRDTAEKALNIEISSMSAAEVMNNNQKIIDSVTLSIQEATRDWGIIICEVNVLGLEPDHATNTAMSTIPQAKARATAVGIDAEARKRQLILESEGEAQARVNLLTAEGEGLRAAAEKLGISGADYRAGEIAQKVLGDKAVIIGADGIAGAMSIGKTILGGSK
jgi:regulator of protease activity HflC (stomatin/prohibitin superfamily)